MKLLFALAALVVLLALSTALSFEEFVIGMLVITFTETFYQGLD